MNERRQVSIGIKHAGTIIAYSAFNIWPYILYNATGNK